tara:strand:- start:24174 stop:24611 length:438 start_codon:yes stop_codon:yes gene_type:complete
MNNKILYFFDKEPHEEELFSHVVSNIYVKKIKKKVSWSEKEIIIQKYNAIQIIEALSKHFNFFYIIDWPFIENLRGSTQVPMRYVFATDKDVSFLSNKKFTFNYYPEIPIHKNTKEIHDFILKSHNSTYLNKTTKYYEEFLRNKR